MQRKKINFETELTQFHKPITDLIKRTSI